jgi:hypothetical protein
MSSPLYAQHPQAAAVGGVSFDARPSARPRLFAIDARSLALFRITLALVLLGDLWVRAHSLVAHYTDAGVLPRAVLLECESDPALWSLHVASGSAAFAALLFLAAGVAAAALLIGYRSRLAVAASWILLCSLQARNPLVLQGGDDLLRLLVFWCFFLPVGRRFSVDALRAPAVGSDDVLSAGTVALVIQVCCVYWFAVGLKWGREWWQEGSAVSYALHLDLYATRYAALLTRSPRLLPWLTRATLVWEAVGPLLLFAPWRRAHARLAVVAAFITMHCAFGCFLAIGIFPAVCLAAWLAFLPATFWQRVERSRRWTRARGRLLAIAGRTAVVGLPPTATTRDARHRRLRPGSVAAAVCIVLVVAVNLREARLLRRLPRAADTVVQALRLDQRWTMFAPHPPKATGWLVIPAKLRDGREVDLFRGGAPVSWRKPLHWSELFSDDRWRKYTENLISAAKADHRMHFGRFLCRRWNDAHRDGETLETFRIVYFEQAETPDGVLAAPREMTLWNHHCF